ncbi:type II secretion system F family protein [Kitasatospora sp. NPDC050543]|uniref:type II secretion system F family protein n=1 Tax=Kitasatospora sp. NPDC050543 TaxID=3364054 RepID=UPI0037B4B59A
MPVVQEVRAGEDGRVARCGRQARAAKAGRAVVAVAAGLGAGVSIGGAAGPVAGVLLAAGAYRWLPRGRTPAARRAAAEREALRAQLPLTAELLAACLATSGSPATAVEAVGQSVGAQMGLRLAAISAELALGAPPELCWNRLGEQCPELAPLARCLVRTSISGAPPTAPLLALAKAQRATAARAAHTRARRAGVLATAPLGVCFLPAFVLISVVPVVLGLAAVFAGRA